MERSRIAQLYLSALGLQRQDPELAYLTEITRRHVARFAFCSLGPRLGDALPLDLPSLYERIVERRRGGYCFEQNGLLFEVLQELGFAVELYLARVIYNRDVHPGLTHRVTLVECDGERYVVDVGFGPLGPRAPIPLNGLASTQGGRSFRVHARPSGDWHVQVYQDGDYFSLYRFELSQYGQADCELGHFYSHRHPAASFVNHLVASRILDSEVRSLRNREYRVISAEGERCQAIDSAAQLQSILTEAFDIAVSAAECRTLFESSP